jgi:hypothetical protein
LTTIDCRRCLDKVLADGAQDPRLSQADLLACLLPLSAVRFDDVRCGVLKGLANFLQSSGQLLEGGEHGGWRSVLEVLGSVPLTHTSAVFRSEWLPVYQRYWSASLSAMSSEENSPDGESDGLPCWPKEALADAFSSTSLIADEFLDCLLPDPALVQSLLEVLSLFGSQTADTNISLTAVEVLWKVADSAIRQSLQSQCSAIEGVLEVMLLRLYQLSLDSRPEIRHCAINTLFTALANNIGRISAEQWRKTFTTIVQPLFDKAGARSQLAMKINEQAVAPELKKGVKMIVHHSRDTAHKQWSETRVLMLRGLLRIIKVSTSLLQQQPEFAEIWIRSAEICRRTVITASEEAEISSTGTEVLFSMLKAALELCSNKTDCTNMLYGSFFSSLWKQIALVAACNHGKLSFLNDLVNKISELYILVQKMGQLQDNLPYLLDGIVALSFRLLEDTVPDSKSKREQAHLHSQILAAIVALFTDIESNYPEFQPLLVSKACEVCLDTCREVTYGDANVRRYFVPRDIQVEVGELVLRMLRSSTKNAEIMSRFILQQYFEFHFRTSLSAESHMLQSALKTDLEPGADLADVLLAASRCAKNFDVELSRTSISRLADEADFRILYVTNLFVGENIGNTLVISAATILLDACEAARRQISETWTMQNDMNLLLLFLANWLTFCSTKCVVTDSYNKEDTEGNSWFIEQIFKLLERILRSLK